MQTTTTRPVAARLRVWWTVATVLLVALVWTDPGGVTSLPDVGVALLALTEAMVVGGIFLLALAPALPGAPRVWLVVAAVVGGVFALVQWLPGNPDAYPLVRWDVYTVPTGHVPWTEFVVAGDDQPVGFHPAVPTLPRPYIDQLDPWVDAAAAGDRAARAVVAAALRGVTSDVGTPVDGSVEVRRCAADDSSPTRPATPTCEVLFVLAPDELS
jgi:hypothetical protein